MDDASLGRSERRKTRLEVPTGRAGAGPLLLWVTRVRVERHDDRSRVNRNDLWVSSNLL